MDEDELLDEYDIPNLDEFADDLPQEAIIRIKKETAIED